MRFLTGLIFLFIFSKSLLGYSALEGVDNITRRYYAHQRSPAFAYTLSVIFPGGGHLYLKNYDYFSRYLALETTTPILAYFVYGSLTEHLDKWQRATTIAERKRELNWMTFYGIVLYSTVLVWFGSKFADIRAIPDSLRYLEKFEANIGPEGSGSICYRTQF